MFCIAAGIDKSKFDCKNGVFGPDESNFAHLSKIVASGLHKVKSCTAK